MTDTTAVVILGLLVLVVLLLVVIRSIKTIRPDEMGVVVLLGSFKGLLRPGLQFVSPLANVHRVKMNTRTLALGTWSVPVAGRTLALTGTLSFRVTDAARATFQVAKLDDEMIAQTRAAVAASLGGPTEPHAGSATVALVPTARAQLDDALAKCGVTVESLRVQQAPG